MNWFYDTFQRILLGFIIIVTWGIVFGSVIGAFVWLIYAHNQLVAGNLDSVYPIGTLGLLGMSYFIGRHYLN